MAPSLLADLTDSATPAEPRHAASAVPAPETPTRSTQARATKGPEPRPLVGARPLGAHLLDAVRAATPARPVAGFVPAVLSDPVTPRESAERRSPAPVRPPLPELGARRPTPGHPDDLDDASPHASARDHQQAEASDPEAAEPVELPPGLPDWWPAESGTWSVRDVDPFQADSRDAAAADDEEPARDTTPDTDAGPALRQRVRPTRDPATGTPVTRRVPFPGLPGDEGPALRQVRRPRPPAPDTTTNVHLDPHLPVLDRDPVAHLELPEPASVPGDASAPEPGPAAPVVPAPRAGAAAMSAEDVADHVRHALLVERERSGALADQW